MLRTRQDQIACVGDSPTDHEGIRVNDGREVRQPPAEPSTDVGERLDGNRVSASRRIGDVCTLNAFGCSVPEFEKHRRFRSPFGRQFPRFAHERVAARVLLPTPGAAAPTQPAIRHGIEMTDLRSNTVGAAQNASIHHDPTTDACANGHHDHVLEPDARAEPRLRPRRRRTVVLHHAGQARGGFQNRAHRNVGPCQVGCEIDQGAGFIDAAGNADTDADDRSVDTCLQLVDDVRYLCQYGAGVVTRCGATGRAKDGAVSIHDPGGDLRAADVDTDGHSRHGLRLARGVGRRVGEHTGVGFLVHGPRLGPTDGKPANSRENNRLRRR